MSRNIQRKSTNNFPEPAATGHEPIPRHYANKDLAKAADAFLKRRGITTSFNRKRRQTP